MNRKAERLVRLAGRVADLQRELQQAQELLAEYLDNNIREDDEKVEKEEVPELK